jgi:hypothetical protein
VGYPFGEIPVVLDQACVDKMIHQINLGTRIGFFEPESDASLPSYEGVRPYNQAAFSILNAWSIDGVVRIAIEPMRNQSGWYFWRAFQAGAVRFSPLFSGQRVEGCMRIDASTFKYLCTDAFLVGGS